MLGIRSFARVVGGGVEGGRGAKVGIRSRGGNSLLEGVMQIKGNAKNPGLICAPRRRVLGAQEKILVYKVKNVMLV